MIILRGPREQWEDCTQGLVLSVSSSETNGGNCEGQHLWVLDKHQ